MEDYLRKPESLWFWMKKSARTSLPMQHDFDKLGESLVTIGRVILRMVVRLLILLTFPISIPLFSIVMYVSNIRIMERRAKQLSEEWDGFPPMYTKEQVQDVLSGNKTLSELEKEKELSYLSSVV